VATIDLAFRSWLEEFERLLPQVNAWFRQATSRFAPPPDKGCRMVAGYVMAFRHPVDDISDTRKHAIKHGKLFLRYVEPERRQIAAMVSFASRGRPFGNWFDEAKETLYLIEEIQRHLAALLPPLSPRRDANRDPIRLLASVALQAWAEANDGRAPRSKNPDAPLCRFLVGALAAVGQNRSPAEISEVLRGRRRSRRDGQDR